MKVGGSPGMQAAQQLMQARNQVADMSASQIQAVSQELNQTKAQVLQNTAQQTAALAERKGNFIDLMA